MKKLGLILGVAGILLVYSLAIRHNDNAVIKPATLNQPSSHNNQTAASGNPPTANSSAAPVSYKDGTYTGSSADAYYGNIQIAAVISGGKIIDVKVLQYPNSHSTSVMINQQALPYLKQETLQSQSANIQIVSGATFSSQAYMQSLQSALSQA